MIEVVARTAALTHAEREELLTEAERLASIGSYVWMLGDRVIWSDGMFRLLGREPDDAVAPHEFFAAVHADDRARVLDAWSRAAAGAGIEPIEYRLVWPDGTVRYVRGTGEGSYDAAGRLIRYVGTVIDLTAQREAEIAAAVTLRTLEEAQRVSNTGSFVVTPGDGSIYWSRGLYRIAGMPDDRPPDPALSIERIHPDDRARHLAWYHQIAATGEGPPIRVRVRLPDGTIRHTETHAARIRLDLDGVERIVGTTFDITERVELEEQLRHAAKMEAIGTLAAGVAHDFNNYLTVISGAMELLGRGPSDASGTAEMVHHAVKQCTLLTRQLLAFARKQPYAPATIDLADLTRGTGRMLGRILDERVELILETGDDPVPIEADPGHLEHVIVNLVANARDAMPAGGRLRIAVTTLQVTPAERGPAGIAPGSWARLDVSDSGDGIKPEDLPHIWEPYFTTKATGQGTGLGLASVYGTVRQNRGHVAVTSELGRGTCVSVFLPLGERMSVPVARCAAPVRVGSGTVLIVEDMPELRRIVARALEASGYQTLEAANGADALAMLDGGAAIDVVLSDIVMPVMGGVELAEAIAARARAPRVVLMTGYAERRAVSRIACPVVAKPLSLDELLQVLEPPS